MRRERLAQLMRAELEAIGSDSAARATHEIILSVFQALYQGDITAGRAVYLLNQQAVYWANEPAQAILYRQAAAALRQMQREEH